MSASACAAPTQNAAAPAHLPRDPRVVVGLGLRRAAAQQLGPVEQDAR